MVRLFITSDAFGILAKRELCKKERERMDWVVDIVPLVTTCTVCFDSEKKTYAVNEFVRDNKGDWKNSEVHKTKDGIGADKADAVEDLLAAITGDSDEKGIEIALLMAVQTEDYLEAIGFWEKNEKPDVETGGVLIETVGEELQAKVVFGKDRPDMKFVPLRPQFGPNGLTLEAGEPEMGRPYYDEFMGSLMENLKNGAGSEVQAEFATEHALEDSSETEVSDGFLENLGRFYAEMDTINEILQMDIEPNDQDLTFALEITDLPYTMVYAPSSEQAKKTVRMLDGIPGIEEADAFLMFFERTIMGSYDIGIKAALTVKHGGAIQGGSKDQSIGENLGAFLNFAVKLNSFLHDHDVFNAYQRMNTETSGIMLAVNDGEIKGKEVSGKERPDMKCRDSLNIEFLFAKELPIVTARPYSDEVAAGMMLGCMSEEELIEAAEEGDHDAMERLSQCYLNGDDETEIEPDAEKAAYWLTKLAEDDASSAQFNLGLFYAKGYGVARSFEKALYWMEKAEENGDEDAPGSIGLLKKALNAEKTVASGDAQAQADLASVYMYLGKSLDQAGPQDDFDMAFDLAQKSAAQDNGDGIWALALCYEHGRGVTEDKNKAVELYVRGAELGHAPSQHSYACYLFRGEIVKRDDKKAFELCMKSAEQGYGLAMADVGRCYQFGNGTMGNMKKAVDWYEKSLEVQWDAELAAKVNVFKMMGEADANWGEDYPGCDDIDEDGDVDASNLPDGYMEALAAFAEAEEKQAEEKAEKEKLEKKLAAVEQDIKELENMNRELREILSEVRSERMRAESRFESARSELESLSYGSIDVFAYDFESRLREIIHTANSAARYLNRTCTSLVRRLDRMLRESIDNCSDATLARDVAREIAELNEAAEINIDFSGTFNSMSMGHLADIDYTPTSECCSIELYWKQRAYEPVTGGEDAILKKHSVEKKDYQRYKDYKKNIAMFEQASTAAMVEEAKEAFLQMKDYSDAASYIEKCEQKAVRLKAEEEATQKAEAERVAKRRAEEEAVMRQAEEDLRAYREAHNAWRVEKKRVTELREKEVEKQCAAFREALKQAANRKKEKIERELEEKKEVAHKEQREAEMQLHALWFFKFRKKAACKERIKNATKVLEGLREELQQIHNAWSKEMDGIEKRVSKQKKIIEAAIKEEHPLSEEPQKPKRPEISNEALEEIILAEMRKGKNRYRWYEPKELVELVPDCYDRPPVQVVSAIMRGLLTRGLLEWSGSCYALKEEKPATQSEQQGGSGLTPSQIRNAKALEEIMNYMSDGGWHTVDEIYRGMPACAEMTQQRVSALLRMEVNNGTIERIEKKRNFYFRLTQ